MKKTRSIPPYRVVFYTLLGSFFLIFAAYQYTSSSIEKTLFMREQLFSLGEKIQKKRLHQTNNKMVFHHFLGKDHLFLHNKISSLSLLEKEKRFLQQRMDKLALPEDLILKKRLSIITGAENSLSFSEGPMEIGSHYKEIIEHQNKAVEIDSADLERVLSLLEGEALSSPHLLISEAKIERKKSVIHEVWSAFFHVLRREYTE